MVGWGKFVMFWRGLGNAWYIFHFEMVCSLCFFFALLGLKMTQLTASPLSGGGIKFGSLNCKGPNNQVFTLLTTSQYILLHKSIPFIHVKTLADPTGRFIIVSGECLCSQLGRWGFF